MIELKGTTSRYPDFNVAPGILMMTWTYISTFPYLHTVV